LSYIFDIHVIFIFMKEIDLFYIYIIALELNVFQQDINDTVTFLSYLILVNQQG